MPAPDMQTSPAYWLILASEVGDAAAQARYAAAWAPIAERYQARVQVLDAARVLAEPDGHARVLTVAFPSLEAARACHGDPAYQAAVAHVLPVSLRALLILPGEPPAA